MAVDQLCEIMSESTARRRVLEQSTRPTMIWWMSGGNHIPFLGLSSVALYTIMGLLLVAWTMHTRSSGQWTIGQTEIMIKKV